MYVIGITLLLIVTAAVLILRRLALGVLDRCPECEHGWLKFDRTIQRQGICYNVYDCTNRQCDYILEERVSLDEMPAA